MRTWLLTCSSVVFVSSLVLGGCGAQPRQVSDSPADDKPKSGDEPATKWEGAAPAPKAEEGTTKPGVRPVHEATARRTDQYDKEATEIVIKRAARQVKENCGAAKDDNGKATGPWGKATLQLQLGSNGHSKGVTVPSPYQGKPSGNCVEKAFSNLTFPPWGGADTEVSWDVELVAPAPAPDAKK